MFQRIDVLVSCPPDCRVCHLTRDIRNPAFRQALHARQKYHPNASDRDLIAYGSGWLIGHHAGLTQGTSPHISQQKDQTT